MAKFISMARFISISIVAAFGFLLFVSFVTMGRTSGREFGVFYAQYTGQLIGFFAVAVSLLAMLVLAVQGAKPAAAELFLLPLFGGLYLAEPHWVLPLVLGVVVITRMICEIVRQRLAGATPSASESL